MNATISEIQAKTETLKVKFLELANQFEAETGTHIHLAIYHPYNTDQCAILTCDVKVPGAA